MQAVKSKILKYCPVRTYTDTEPVEEQPQDNPTDEAAILAESRKAGARGLASVSKGESLAKALQWAERVQAQMKGLGSNIMLVLPGGVNQAGVRLGAQTRQRLTEEDALAISLEVPEVQVAAPTSRTTGQVVGGNTKLGELKLNDAPLDIRPGDRVQLVNLDPDDDELTRTRKVRRNFIADKYGVLVEALYSGKQQQFIETLVKFEDGRTGSVSATLTIVDARRHPASAKAAA